MQIVIVAGVVLALVGAAAAWCRVADRLRERGRVRRIMRRAGRMLG